MCTFVRVSLQYVFEISKELGDTIGSKVLGPFQSSVLLLFVIIHDSERVVGIMSLDNG